MADPNVPIQARARQLMTVCALVFVLLALTGSPPTLPALPWLALAVLAIVLRDLPI